MGKFFVKIQAYQTKYLQCFGIKKRKVRDTEESLRSEPEDLSKSEREENKETVSIKLRESIVFYFFFFIFF